MILPEEISQSKEHHIVIKNPFAKIAKASKENGGSLPEDVRHVMMQEAIREVREKTILELQKN